MYILTTSASRGNTYLDCPFKYFLTYEVYICNECGEPTYISELENLCINLDQKICLNPKCGSKNLSKLYLPSSWGGIYGSIIHKVLELYANARREKAKDDDWRLDWRTNFINAYFGKLDGYNTPTETFMTMWATSKNQKILLPVEDCSECIFKCDQNVINGNCPKNVFNQGLDMIADAIERYDNLFKEKCLGTEQEFKIEIGEYKGIPIVVTGFMDVIFELDKDTIEVIDYKSGTYTKNSYELMNDNQAGIYSLAIKHLYPKHKYHFLTFDYFTAAPVTVTFNTQEDERMKQRVIKIFQQVVDNKTPRRIPLSKDGNIFYKCQYMCHRPTCDEQWEIFQNRYGRSGL